MNSYFIIVFMGSDLRELVSNANETAMYSQFYRPTFKDHLELLLHNTLMIFLYINFTTKKSIEIALFICP
jgi:hypothetical protein